MMHRIFACSALAVCLMAGCSSVSGTTGGPPADPVYDADPRPGPDGLVASEDVSAETANQAFALAAQTEALSLALRGARVIPVSVELVRIKADRADGETASHHYLVTHYQYGLDLAFLTLVDLQDRVVVSQEQIPHLPVRLTQGELDEARELAFANREVVEILGSDIDRVTVGPLVMRTSDRTDPYFGHRVVRLLFRVGQAYRGDISVEVDLTARTVRVDRGQHGPSRERIHE